MNISPGFADDLPDLPHVRQLKAGFHWLKFDPELEKEFRRSRLDETIDHVRANLCLAIVIAIAFSAMEALVLGPKLDRIPSEIHILAIVPLLLVVLAASFSPQRQRIYAPVTIAAMTLYGLSQVAIQLVASSGGVAFLYPCMILTAIFIYFMAGLVFYQALATNVAVLFGVSRRCDRTADVGAGIQLRRARTGDGQSRRRLGRLHARTDEPYAIPGSRDIARNGRA